MDGTSLGVSCGRHADSETMVVTSSGGGGGGYSLLRDDAVPCGGTAVVQVDRERKGAPKNENESEGKKECVSGAAWSIGSSTKSSRHGKDFHCR